MNFLKFKKQSYRNMYLSFVIFSLKNFKFFISNSIGKRKDGNIAFWITPWIGTPYPWYALAFAQIYSYIYKEKVTVVVNDLMYDSELEQYKELQSILNRSMFWLKCNRNISIKYLSDYNRSVLTQEDYKILKQVADNNAIWKLRTSKPSIGFDKLSERIEKELEPICSVINTFLKNNSLRIVLPGGMFAETGYLVEKIKKTDCSFYTIDGGVETLLMGNKSLAAQIGDTQRVVEMVYNCASKEKLIEKSKELFDIRKFGRLENSALVKNYKVQKSSFNEKDIFNVDIVICPNIEYDTAAIGTHYAFKNDYEWLTETVEYILNNTRYTVAVREHPMQLLFERRTMFSYLRKYEENGRFKLFTCRNKVNTYRLINEAKLVIVDTSHIGIEAAIMGKRVLMDSNAFYSSSSFVIGTKNKKDYFNNIKNIDDAVLSEKSIEEAHLYNGISSICCGADTIFKPDTGEYYKWIGKSVDEIMKEGDTELIFSAINEDVPLSFLIYKKMFGEL